MVIPTKKLNNGFEMPVFGIGTYTMGENSEVRQIEIDSIKFALSAGVTHIDTAEVYANGEAEKIVSKSIQNFNRKNLFLTSKVKQDNLSYEGIWKALQQSLEKLQTNYLDLYLMHRCPLVEKFEECVQAMNELVDKGLVKHIGLSNTNTEHTKILNQLTKHPFEVNQSHYNLQFREVEKDGLVEYCKNNEMYFQAWRPLNKAGSSKNGVNFTKPGITLSDEICKKYNKTPAQISINWLISQKNIITLAKSTNPKHLADNLGALGWEMEKEDIEKLRNEFPDQKFISDTVPLA